MNKLLLLLSTPANYTLMDLDNIERNFYESFCALDKGNKYTDLYGELFATQSFNDALANQFVTVNLELLSKLTKKQNSKKLYNILKRDLKSISNL